MNLCCTSLTTGDSLPRIVTAIGARSLTTVLAHGNRRALLMSETLHCSVLSHAVCVDSLSAVVKTASQREKFQRQVLTAYRHRVTVRTCHSEMSLLDLLEYYKQLTMRIGDEASNSG